MAVLWSLSVILAGLFLFYTNGVHAGENEYLGGPFLHRAVNQAIESVDRAYRVSRNIQKEKVHKREMTPSGLMQMFKSPTSETRRVVRAAEYMDLALQEIQSHVQRIHKRSLNATELLSPDDLDSIARVTGCRAMRQPPVCSNDCWSNRYRTFTSVCNNRDKPYLGASNTVLNRWLPARYEDGISLPLGWTPNKLHSGFRLPLVRVVSNEILKVDDKNVVSDEDSTHLFMQWGQWIDHDMSLSPLSGSLQTFNDGINCEQSCEQKNPCFPIKIPQNDPKFKGSETCMPFFRSAPACGTGELGAMFGQVSTRQQINSLTSFLDVNEVYGSTDCLANKLRNLTSEEGLLAVNQEYSDNGREYLPFNSISSNLCGIMGEACDFSQNSTPCFIGGDVRVNEQLGLLSFHVMFLREHNRIARELKKLNPHWSGNTTYHEARKILGAFQQIINHRDYVPRVIGIEATEKYLSEYEGYDESVNPSIANVFSTACFRFGHLSIQPTLFRLNNHYQEHPEFPNLPLHLTFFTPWRMIREGGADPIVRGLVGRPAKLQKSNKMLVDELREKLFKLTSHIALDLGALNMQRSRDHGLQGYSAWRKFCGLSQPENAFQLGQVLGNTGLANKLLQLYGTTENIDVWLGAISEPFVRGGKVGPLLACLIGQQFKNLRDGDRFWWENPEVFTIAQRQALTQISMSRIICDNTGIQVLPYDAFKYHRFPDGYVNCNEIPQVDLSAWREDVQVTPCGAVPSVDHAHFSICKSSVRYTCQSGFIIQGADTITCLSNGQWEQRPPSCVANAEDLETPCSSNLKGDKGDKGEKGDTGPQRPEGDCSACLQKIKQSAFTAKLKTRNTHPFLLIPIPCETEIYNGQKHFNCDTGIFTCVFPGVYQFSYSWEIASRVSLALKINGLSVINSERSSANLLVGDIIYQLKAGDKVWLEIQQGSQRIYNDIYFQGHLIYSV
ncbi:eosinophil peroxidase-like [Hemitrygon akajei]|uniref:eosinophil peroxidase-like n=1 Tax=Hemitrygon akajei TaxID=2704970 RepID=UPI003BFA2BAE